MSALSEATAALEAAGVKTAGARAALDEAMNDEINAAFARVIARLADGRKNPVSTCATA